MRDIAKMIEELEMRIEILESERIVMLNRIYELQGTLSTVERLVGDHEYNLTEAQATLTEIDVHLNNLTEKFETLENNVSDIILLKD